MVKNVWFVASNENLSNFTQQNEKIVPPQQEAVYKIHTADITQKLIKASFSNVRSETPELLEGLRITNQLSIKHKPVGLVI